MELTHSHYEQISDCFPRHRDNVNICNLDILNAFLYVVENGCKWRSLPEKYGNWHVVYMRISRWAKSGALDRAFYKL
ncbi:MAG: transposase [Prevotellaceae bacterium]|jgi:transposase|nr:transposase [Prevotellaceae bacterium]